MIREPIWKAVWRVNRAVPMLLAALLLLNVLLFLYLAYALEGHASATQAEFIRLQAEQRQALRGEDASDSPLMIYTRGTEDLKRFRAAIPPASELSGLVDELFRLAGRSGLSIDRVQYESKTDDDLRLLHYKITYQVSGTYEQLKKMVHLIEQSGRLITIDSLLLGSTRKDNRVGLSLTLTTFFRTDAA